MTDLPPDRRRSTVRLPNTDSPRQGADDVHLEVVAIDTRYWGEEGGSYSPDRRYRWRYERPIGSGPAICWIGLNPGTGDREGRYRPTLQRMVDRSVHLGMGRFILVNLFSWRATDPRDLRAAAAAGHDIIGSATDQVIADAVRGAAVVVAAWGHHGTLLGRERQVLDTIPNLMCVGLTAKRPPTAPAVRGSRATTRPAAVTEGTQRQRRIETLASAELASVDTERSARAVLGRIAGSITHQATCKRAAPAGRHLGVDRSVSAPRYGLGPQRCPPAWASPCGNIWLRLLSLARDQFCW